MLTKNPSMIPWPNTICVAIIFIHMFPRQMAAFMCCLIGGCRRHAPAWQHIVNVPY